MARITQIIEVDSTGHKVRTDEGSYVTIPHDAACVPCIGEELEIGDDGRLRSVPGGLPHLTSRLDGDRAAMIAANIASEFVSPRETVKTSEPESNKGAGVPEQPSKPAPIILNVGEGDTGIE